MPRAGAKPLRLQFLAAALSGVLYFLAYPGVGCWPLGFVALVPLLLALRGASAKRALLLGWVAGVLATGLGFYWVVPLLRQFGGFAWPTCVLLAMLLCIYQAGRLGLSAWLSGLSAAHGWPLATSFGGAFLAVELGFPVLFPWYFGAVLHERLALIQIADLAGISAVSGLLVVTNLGATELCAAAFAKRAPHALPLLAALLAPSLAYGYGALRIPQIDAATRAAPSALVGVIQANVSVDAKSPANAASSLSRHLALSRALLTHAKPDFLLWSETAAATAVREDTADDFFRTALGELPSTPTLFGAVLASSKRQGAPRELTNSALLLDPKAPTLERYDKHRLLMFGEYLPFSELLPHIYRFSPRSGHFRAGRELNALSLGEHRIAAFICYEDVLPDLVNELVGAARAELLVNLSNDAWFGDTSEPWIHLALARFRSIEQRRYLVRSNNSGVSAVIDPVGRVTRSTQPFTEGSFVAPIAWLDTRTLYGSLGPLSGLFLVAGFVLGGLLLRSFAAQPVRPNDR